MANLKSLAKDTAIYGLSSIVGRFLNYLLVPLYTHCISAADGGYGVVTQLYAYTALFMVILTFGMETTFFRFINKEDSQPHTVFTTTMATVSTLAVVFLVLVLSFIHPLSSLLGHEHNHNYIIIMAFVVVLDVIQSIPFCYLRFQGRAVRFASLKLLFIFLNIGLNLYYFLYLGHSEVIYVFLLNLTCTALITLCFIPDLLRIRWQFDFSLLRKMLSYSWPILILGIMGILNQTADKMIFPFIYPDKEEAIRQLGIYGACVKIAMIMAMITQAFRFAYEPFVFAQCREKDKDRNHTYALGMKYFVIFTLLAFLCVVGYMPLLRHLIGMDYWEGLRVVPIVMAAEIMMGIYFNLSFWYKLIDKTIYGAWFSFAGCVVLCLVNVLFIPRFSYMACAWGGFAGYGTAMVLSYIVGQRINPIPYPLRSIGTYVAIAVLFYLVMQLQPDTWPVILRLGINTLIILAFVGHIVYHDFPLSSLPVVGKYFRK